MVDTNKSKIIRSIQDTVLNVTIENKLKPPQQSIKHPQLPSCTDFQFRTLLQHMFSYHAFHYPTALHFTPIDTQPSKSKSTSVKKKRQKIHLLVYIAVTVLICKCHGRQLPAPNRCNLGGGSVWDVVVQPSRFLSS